mmetsp:Transcript_22823/g.55582  ORF Transcript_22823/g.55582 Transcript_22823/m.55582 type:complete len:244 (+) Transcript_22823:670-1401(+)
MSLAGVRPTLSATIPMLSRRLIGTFLGRNTRPTARTKRFASSTLATTLPLLPLTLVTRAPRGPRFASLGTERSFARLGSASRARGRYSSGTSATPQRAFLSCRLTSRAAPSSPSTTTTRRYSTSLARVTPTFATLRLRMTLPTSTTWQCSPERTPRGASACSQSVRATRTTARLQSLCASPQTLWSPSPSLSPARVTTFRTTCTQTATRECLHSLPLTGSRARTPAPSCRVCARATRGRGAWC